MILILIPILILILILVHTALTVLIQRRRIQHRVIAARNKLRRQMRAVMHREQIPPIDGTDDLTRRSNQRQRRSIKPIIMSRRAIHNIPRRRRVAQVLRRAIVDSSMALVEVLVAVQHDIDAILEEDGLEGRLALDAWRSADVPRTMTGGDDPGRLGAVDGSEVLLQPFELGAGRGEGTGVLGGGAAGEVGGGGEVGLGVELDEVHEAVVEGVPEVLDAAGLGGGHAGEG